MDNTLKISQIPVKRSISQWICSILIFFILIFFRYILNEPLGLKHGGGFFLAGCTFGAILSISSAVFYAPFFKSNKNNRKNYIHSCYIAIIMTIISCYMYIGLYKEKFSSNIDTSINLPNIEQKQHNNELNSYDDQENIEFPLLSSTFNKWKVYKYKNRVSMYYEIGELSSLKLTFFNNKKFSVSLFIPKIKNFPYKGRGSFIIDGNIFPVKYYIEEIFYTTDSIKEENMKINIVLSFKSISYIFKILNNMCSGSTLNIKLDNLTIKNNISLKGFKSAINQVINWLK